MCRSQGSNKSEPKRDSRKSEQGLLENVLTNAEYMRSMKSVKNDMEDSSEQVQSLFYS